MIGLPPKPKFTKDEITNAALTVAREKGIGAVSAREVAVVLGTSTRPIFTYYHTMDELKKEVRLFAENIFRQYVEKGLAMEPPFLGVGVQYLQFAQDEPKLYQLLYMTRPEEGQCSAGRHGPGTGTGAGPTDADLSDGWPYCRPLFPGYVAGSAQPVYADGHGQLPLFPAGGAADSDRLQPEPVQGAEGSARLRGRRLRPGRSLSKGDRGRESDVLRH